MQLDRRILHAARVSFSSCGYSGTTLELVASACGTTRRSVTSRYVNRDGLLIAVAKMEFEQMLSDISATTEHEAGPIDELKSVCRMVLARSLQPDQIGMFRVYIGEVVRLPQLSMMLIQTADTIESRIEHIVRQLQAQGAFQKYSASSVATTAMAIMAANPINRATFSGEVFRTDADIERYFAGAWEIFLLMA